MWHEHNIKRIHAVNTRLYRFVASTCAWVVGPSRAVTDNLAKAGLPARKLVPLYNGIDLAKFAPDDARARRVRQELGWANATPVVGLFGQLFPHKGHDTLIDAAAAIRAQVPGTRFVFVGALENPPYEAHLRARWPTAGLTDAFQFTGWRTDVPDVMRAVDLLVVPTTSQEPAALSLMEGMAMGRPLVATRTGGTPEIILDGETGLIFPPGDAQALTAHASRSCAIRSGDGRWARRGARAWSASSPSRSTSPDAQPVRECSSSCPWQVVRATTTRFWTAFEESAPFTYCSPRLGRRRRKPVVGWTILRVDTIPVRTRSGCRLHRPVGLRSLSAGSEIGLPSGCGRGRDILPSTSQAHYPGYYPALLMLPLFLAAVELAKPLGGETVSWSRVNDLFLNRDMLLHLLMLQNGDLTWTFPEQFNPLLWSVATEWSIYVLFAFVLVPIWRHVGVEAAAVASLAIAWVTVILPVPGGGSLGGYPHLVGAFGVGLFAASTLTRVINSVTDVSLVRAVAVSSCLAAGLAFGVIAVSAEYVRLTPESRWLTDLLVALSVGSLILVAALGSGGTSLPERIGAVLVRALEGPVTRALGAFSYSLYLTHLATWSILSITLSLAPVADLIHLSLEPLPWRIFIVVPFQLVCAYWFYRMFELPFTRRAGHSSGGKGAPVASPATTSASHDTPSA